MDRIVVLDPFLFVIALLSRRTSSFSSGFWFCPLTLMSFPLIITHIPLLRSILSPFLLAPGTNSTRFPYL